MSILALGLDPGFTAFGWSVVRVGVNDEELVALGVLRTKKGKDAKLKRDDDHRRYAELARGLLEVTSRWRPAVICAEALTHVPARPGRPGRPRRPAPVLAVSKGARVWGLVDMLSEVYRVALLQAAPQTIKKATTGKASASKPEVQAALDERFAGRVAELLAPIRAKSVHEHPVDATGAVIALREHESIRIALAGDRPALPFEQQGQLAL